MEKPQRNRQQRARNILNFLGAVGLGLTIGNNVPVIINELYPSNTKGNDNTQAEMIIAALNQFGAMQMLFNNGQEVHLGSSGNEILIACEAGTDTINTFKVRPGDKLSDIQQQLPSNLTLVDSYRTQITVAEEDSMVTMHITGWEVRTSGKGNRTCFTFETGNNDFVVSTTSGVLTFGIPGEDISRVLNNEAPRTFEQNVG